jgi:uncharacterized protein (TIGR02271 family)
MSENPANSRFGDETSPEGPVINWDRIIHKNVRTADDQGMGKVIAVPDNEDTIIISSQSADDIYRVPRSIVTGFNGAEVQLGVVSSALDNYYVGDDASTYEARPSDLVTDGRANTEQQIPKEQTIPVVEERLNVSKRRTMEEATISKRPEKQQRNLEVPITKEKLVVERRKASSTSTTQKPVESVQEIKVPLKNERIEVTKEPYVKEEVVVKKKPVTETRQVTDTVQTEKVNVKGSSSRSKKIRRKGSE